jgi:hypothetical protein
MNAARQVTLTGAMFCVALGACAALAWMMDPRTLVGVSVWDKPLKFAVSFFVHQLTLFWLIGLLPLAVQHSRALPRIMTLGAAAVLIEMLCIYLQAARGQASHFNTQTALDAFIYFNLMGGAALVIVGVTFWAGVLIWRHRRLASAMHLGAALGLTVGASATLVVAGLLATGALAGPGHWVGTPATDAHGLFSLGWSRHGGDLRVPHFFATHLMQLLPILGWLLDRHKVQRSAVVLTASTVLGVLLVAGTLWQALAGRPFLAFVH